MKYSILFLSLTLLVLVASHYGNQQFQKEHFIKEQIATNVQTVELLQWQQRDKFHQLMMMMEDWSKVQYKDCGTAVERINEHFELVLTKVNQEIKKLDNTTAFSGGCKSAGTIVIQQELDTLKSEIRVILNLLLDENGKTFGYKPNEIDQIRKELFIVLDQPRLKSKIDQSPLIAQLKLSKLLIDVSNTHFSLTHRIARLGASYFTNCGFGLGAVVFPTKHGLKVGDTFKAEVGLGYYSIPESVTDFWITVDGDTLPRPENWLAALFETTIGTDRTVEFDIHYTVRNQITGQETDYSRKQEYEIPLP